MVAPLKFNLRFGFPYTYIMFNLTKMITATQNVSMHLLLKFNRRLLINIINIFLKAPRKVILITFLKFIQTYISDLDPISISVDAIHYKFGNLPPS